jgi:hypothetical protein
MNPYPIANGTAKTDRVDRTKVNFEMNVPQVVTLEFNPPQEPRDGAWGPQYMYFCGDHRIGFFEPAVHAQIVALGAVAGSVVAIVKRRDGRKNRWDVNLVENGKVVARVGERTREAAHELGSRTTAAPAPPGQRAQTACALPALDTREVVHQEDGAPLMYVDAPAAALAEFDEQWRELDAGNAAPTPPKVDGSSTAVEARPAPEPPEQNLARALATAAAPDPVQQSRATALEACALERALKTAIAAAKAAEAYGAKIGYAVRFSAEDVRVMGISMFRGSR